MSLETWDKPNWCPGCGNYGIWTALKKALTELGLPRDKVVMTGGIGCSSKIPYWVNVNSFCGLHGRPVALAIGVKMAKPDLTVIASGGDGDGFAEGTNHFIHLCRTNTDVNYIIHDNQIFALTKGQTSPTSDEGFISKTTPWGAVRALNPISVAIASGATFVARGYAGDVNGLKDLIKRAIKHKGASILDVLQPCVTMNKVNTYAWYQQRVYYLKKQPKSRVDAFKKSLEWGDKIPLGVFYESNEETRDDHSPKAGPVKIRDVSRLIKELM